jgi:hypothetical protein
LCFALLGLSSASAAPLGTAFTYQGKLTDAGVPANGQYDLTFTLYDALNGGAQEGATRTNSATGVSTGLFTVTLDFGADVFTGEARWLEIGVRTNGAADFTMLVPRQELTPTPYAQFAPQAGAAATATTASAVPWTGLTDVPAGLADGVDNDTTYSAGAGLALSGTLFSLDAAFTDVRYWRLGGNVGTIPGTHFVGTTDNQPLEFKVNGQRALRLEPNSSSPNLILGHSLNYVDPAAVGSVIGGGGDSGFSNATFASHATISGGKGNLIQLGADIAAIGGGVGNTVGRGAAWAAIGGGYLNTIQDEADTAVIGGGSLNTIESFGQSSTIAGGWQNLIRAGAHQASINGGWLNWVGENSDWSAIGGGVHNAIHANTWASAIGGGNLNTVEDNCTEAVVCGGFLNKIGTNAQACAIGGGYGNTVEGDCDAAVVCGGYLNKIGTNADFAFIGGGSSNQIQPYADHATIAGGSSNTIQTNASFSVISGGTSNSVAGGFATVPGGLLNSAGGDYSFAAGRRAKGLHQGSFVWADSTDADFASNLMDEFAVRATGGVRFVSGVDSNQVPVAGVSLAPGSGSWADLSDREAKTGFAWVNARELLELVARLPISTWSYKTESNSPRHIGPVAQDFHSAFGLGSDDKHIATVDADGVALAAIQGLNQKLQDTVNQKDARLAALEDDVAELKALVRSLAAQPSGGAQ